MRLIQQIQAFNEGGIVSKLSSGQRQNATLIYNTLISEGIPRTVALGILGNVMQESSMNPQASTNLYTGFAQWDKNRLPNLQKFAKNLGTDIYDPTTQAKFIAHELKNQYKTVLEEASKVNTPQDAAEIIAEKYEAAGDKSSYKKRGQYATDFSSMFGENKEFKTKSSNVNISNVHNNLTHYLRTLPQNLQQKILITSGNDQGHSETSRHYKNRAVDLRFDDELYNYVKTDPNRLKYGITLLDPNHGTAPHLHLSYGEGTENKKDVWKDPFSPDRDWEVIDLSNEDLDNINQNTASPYLTYEEIIGNRISPADIWEMYKDEPSKAAELIAFKNEYEERLQKEAKEEKQAEVDLQKQALAQAQAEKQMVQKLLTTPTTPQEDYNTQISQPQQPTQPFRFQTDWYIPQMAQKGGTIQEWNSKIDFKYPFNHDFVERWISDDSKVVLPEATITVQKDFIKDIESYLDLPSYPFSEANTKKTIQDSFDFFDGWINSPIYSKIVKERYPSDYKQKQINRLNKSNVDLVGSVSKRGPGYINGIFIPKEGNQKVKNITYTKPNGEIDDYTVNKKYLDDFSEDVSRMGKLDNIYLEYLSYPYMSTHELSHSITEGNRGLTYNDIKEIGQRTNKKPLDYTYGRNNITNENIDYLRDPTEVQARINSSRHFLRDKKLYDPYKEKFTKEHLKKIKENIEEYKDANLYDLFRSVNSDDDFIWLMNNIVYNEKQANTNTFIAQKGGTISPLQRIKQKFQQI